MGDLYNIGSIGDGSSTGGGVPAYGSFAALPVTATLGDLAITTDDGNLYWWDGAAWVIPNAEVVTVGVNNTNSVSLAVVADKVEATVRLSGDAAQAGYFKASTTIKSGGSPGLHVEAPVATASLTGFLSSGDWSTFNAKEPAISSGTTAQFWRGDKSFQPLNIEALAARNDGSYSASGKIGERAISTVTGSTPTGVGATGVWGSITSIALGAGVWQIQGVAALEKNSAELTDFVACGISTSATGMGIDDFDFAVLPSLMVGGVWLTTTPMVLVSLTGAQTYYLNTKFNYSSGTPTHRGRLTAIRIG